MNRRDPVTGRMIAVPLAQKFWEKVLLGPGCWEWEGQRASNQYGILRGGRKCLLAHRVSWELAFGAPGDLSVLHRCDNRGCVRPDHLFLGTQLDNIRDMDAKGRRVNAPSFGEANGSSKLSEGQVREIRALGVSRQITRKDIARRFSVSVPLVEKILAGKVWKEIL